jgi:hypothetical protein
MTFDPISIALKPNSNQTRVQRLENNCAAVEMLLVRLRAFL